MTAKKKEPSPEEFWAQIEKEMGASVLEKGLCRFLESPFDTKHPFWGLIAIFEHGLRIFTFKQENWISALLPNYKSPEPVDEFIASENLKDAFLPSRNFFEKLMANPRIIRINLGMYDKPRLVFEPDRNADAIFAAIEAVMKKEETK